MALVSPHQTGTGYPLQEPRLRNRPAAGSAYSVPSTNPTGRRKVDGRQRGGRGADGVTKNSSLI
jgi:hypothetical protein